MTPSDDEIAAEEWAKACLDACDFKSWVEMTGEEYEKTVKNIFLAGAEHARAKWINVKERLPNGSENVFVYVDYGSIGNHKAIHSIGIDGFHQGKWTECVGVTHWMPLPSAPEAESK